MCRLCFEHSAIHTRRSSEWRLPLPRPGITLLEVLIAIGVIGLLTAILIPVVSSAREASRRARCQSHLQQIGVAIHGYEGTERAFPRIAFTFELLPYIGYQNVYDLFPLPVAPGSAFAEFVPINPHVIPLYICPSDTVPTTYSDPDDPGWIVARTNYMGSIGTAYQRYGWNGFFEPRKQTQPRDFTKGLSTTAAISEALCPLPNNANARLRTMWELGIDMDGPTELDAFADRCERIPLDPEAYGFRGFNEHGVPWHGMELYACSYNHILPPNRPNCMSGSTPRAFAYASGSVHPGGANVLFADGHVEFINQFIDRTIWREMGSRVPLDQIPLPD